MDETQRYTIFSCDGGGFRGYLTSLILDQIEQELNAKLPTDSVSSQPNRSLGDSFDLFAGTSTGSLIAGGLAFGFSAAEIKTIYINNGAQLFPPLNLGQEIWQRLAQVISALIPRPIAETGPDDRFPFSYPLFDGTALKKVLESVFGDAVLKDIQTKSKRLIVTAYNCIHSVPVIFDSENSEQHQVKLVDALIASSAYPGAFPSHVVDGVPLIDGGLVANNPALVALTEYVGDEDVPKTGNVLLAAFGSGSTVLSFDTQESQNMGMLDWTFPFGNPLLSVVFGGHSNITNKVCRILLNAIVGDSSKTSYFRFNPHILTINCVASKSIKKDVTDLVFVTKEQKKGFDTANLQYSSKNTLEEIAAQYLQQSDTQERIELLVSELV